jgi:YegS/Rv2252/BmrU family lipid kinase
VLFCLTEGKAKAMSTARLDRITETLAAVGSADREVLTTPPGIAARIVEVGGQYDCVAIGGGDGTLSAVASALKDTAMPFAIIPLGTANDLARTLELPLDPVAAAAVLRSARLEDIDLGSANGHFFFNAAGIGLSVDVAERMTKLPKRFGPLSYLFAVADIVRARRAFRADITCDGNAISVRSIQVTVGNGKRHGGGVMIHQDASVDDGRFDIYSLEPRPIWHMLALLPSLMRGTHHAWRHVTMLHGETVHVATPHKPKRINLDGEIRTLTPAAFEMHRNAVVTVLPDDSGTPPL